MPRTFRNCEKTAACSSPVYDLVSVAVYSDDPETLHDFAFNIGGETRYGWIMGAHWHEFARDIGVNHRYVHAALRRMAMRVSTHADEILEERIAIEELNLYFYPLYTFEYVWANKDKKALVEFDGVTGEARKGQKISDQLLQSFSYDEMFDFAKEIAGFVPGGGLAMMTGRKAYQIVKKTKLGG